MRLTCFVLALALFAGQAPGGTIVATDSGNIGEFEFTNMGVSGNTATIMASIPGLASQMNTVNGVFVTPVLATVNTPVTFTVTQTGIGTYSMGLIPSTYITTIGAAAGAQALLAFTLDTGVTPITLPSFFNASGRIVALLANAEPNYDFSLFDTIGGGDVNFTFTATSFTSPTGVDSFAQFFDVPGASAVGNGSFSQVATPAVSEPLSKALLGIGISGLLALRRYRRNRC
jgi:hypothetical protein